MPNIEVIRAVLEQQQIVANLLELYAHDFSEFRNLDLDENCRFGYPNLPLYWTEGDRHPFLVRTDGKWAGFIFIKEGSEISHQPDVWDMAEFFVVRGQRRRGIGTRMAHEVWKRFPGRWEIRVMQANSAARRFWENSVTSFAGDAVRSSCFEKNGESWLLLSFESPVTNTI